MGYSNIKRVLSMALLLAFTAPATLAYTTSTVPYSSAMTLNGGVKLTNSNDVITLSLRDSDVKQVLRMFADKAGMNIVFHNTVNGKITLDLVETPINEAFNLVLQVAGLSYYKQGNTMIVLSKTSPDNAAFSKQEMMVFPVKYVSAGKIAEFLNQNVFGMKKAGMSSVDAATVNPASNEIIVFGMPSDAPIVERVIEQFDREPVTKTFSVNHTTPEEMAKMICELLLPAHGINSGSSTKGQEMIMPTSPGTGTGMAASITGFASSEKELKLGEGVVACTASGSQTNKAASAFNLQALSIAYFPQRGTLTMMGGSDAQVRMVEEFIRANDVKQPQALLEISIVELNEQGSKEFQNQWSIGSKHWQANFDGTSFSGGRPGGRAWTQKTEYMWDGGNNAAEMAAGGLPNGRPYATLDEHGQVTGFNIPQQILRTVYSQVPSVHITWMLNYLIENRKARVLANPKIMITNGQESIIDLTQDYVEKVTSEYLTSSYTGTGSTGTAQKEYTIGDDLGIKVALTPFISPEGYVTLNIKPEYSTVSDQVYSAGEGTTRDLVATLLSRRNLDLKNVRIKDGETLVIGGMIQEAEIKTVNKIPFLGDLPLIGSAFRSSATTKSKTELVIMITPKIINDGDDAVAGNL